MTKTLITGCLLSVFSVSVFAADPAALPAKMIGDRLNPANGRSGKVEAELIAMETPVRAKINAAFWDGCSRHGETVAEFNDGAWSFVIPGRKCNDVSVTVRPVEGKNRLEGEFQTGAARGTIWYEW